MTRDDIDKLCLDAFMLGFHFAHKEIFDHVCNDSLDQKAIEFYNSTRDEILEEIKSRQKPSR